VLTTEGADTQQQKEQI